MRYNANSEITRRRTYNGFIVKHPCRVYRELMLGSYQDANLVDFFTLLYDGHFSCQPRLPGYPGVITPGSKNALDDQVNTFYLFIYWPSTSMNAPGILSLPGEFLVTRAEHKST